MPCLNITPTAGARKIYQDKVYLADVPADCKVYLFVFQEMRGLHPELEDALKKWGEETGNNLYVGFWAKKDPEFQKVRGIFKLETPPEIVITAEPNLALIEQTGKTVYTKINNEEITRNKDYVEFAEKTLERIYYLFLDGKVKNAIREAQEASATVRVREYIRRIRDAFRGALDAVGEFLDHHNIKLGFGPFSAEITPK